LIHNKVVAGSNTVTGNKASRQLGNTLIHSETGSLQAPVRPIKIAPQRPLAKDPSLLTASDQLPISSKIEDSKTPGKASQEPVVVKQPVSSENSRTNQPAKTITDSDDDDSDSAVGGPKSVATNSAGKASQEPSQENQTLSSENTEGSPPDKANRKELVESAITLGQPPVLASQAREEPRPNEVTANPGKETRSDLGKEVASAGRKDFHKGNSKEDEGVFSTTPPGTEPAPLLTKEFDFSPGDPGPANIWDAGHFSTSFLFPQAEFGAGPSLDQAGVLGANLAKAGEGSDLRETILSTSPLWGAFFLQSLGRLRPRPHQPTIMVVEGDETKRDQMVMSFADQGYLVVSAPTTHDAMGLLRAPLSPIDLVVLNLNLPDLSGLHLCTYLRKSNPGLQLMVYSDEAEPSELPQLLKLGVSYYRQNPFSLDELIADVNSILH
jgi:CheY-like chemotaxis protein